MAVPPALPVAAQGVVPVPGLQDGPHPEPLDHVAVSPGFVVNPVGTRARAQEVDGEFVVLRGSTARKQGTPSRTSYKALRDLLVQEGKLVDTPDPSLYMFAEGVPFKSPIAAAAVVFGGNQRGPLVWKTENGSQTYRQW